jgi:hypothetical protein
MRKALAAQISELVELEIDIATKRTRADALRAELGLDTATPRRGRGGKRQLSPEALKTISEATEEPKPKRVLTAKWLRAMRANIAKGRAALQKKHALKKREAKPKKKKKLTPAQLRAMRENIAKGRAANLLKVAERKTA